MPRLTEAERLSLHGRAYVERFERAQSGRRIERLLGLLDLPRDAVVADLGCGSGFLLAHLRGRIAAYHGVDFSPEFIAAARARQARLGESTAQFHCESLEAFCARHPQRFDAALALDVSEHVYDDDWLSSLTAIRHALKPDGKLYLHTPDSSFIIERLKARGILRQLPEHIAVRLEQGNVTLLNQAGFTRVSLRHLAHYNVLAPLHLLSDLPVIGKALRARLFIIAQP